MSVYCPHQGCGLELPRRDLAAHLVACPCASSPQHLCPFGCGQRMAASRLEEHKAECLLEPRKLMAAISRLASENERLTLENQMLRDDASGASASSTDASITSGGASSCELQRARKSPRRRRRGACCCRAGRGLPEDE